MGVTVLSHVPSNRRACNPCSSEDAFALVSNGMLTSAVSTTVAARHIPGADLICLTYWARRPGLG